MANTDLPLRVAVQCLDESLVLGKRNFVSLFRIGLIPFLAYSVIAYFFNGRSTPFLVRGPAIIVSYCFYGLTEAVMIHGAWRRLHGQQVDFAGTWRQVREHVPSILMAFTVRLVVIIVGFALFVLPGLYFLATYFAIPTLNVIEGLGVRASLQRSRHLALRNIPGILLSIGTVWLLAALVAWVLPRGLTYLQVSTFSLLRPILAVSWAAAVMPFRAALSARVYLEIRIRKEGYDLEQQLSSLSSAA